MAALNLSGPASTTTVLFGETTANFVTEWRGVGRQSHGAEDSFQAGKRIVGGGGSAPLENVVAVLSADDDRVAAVRRLTGFAEVALEVGKGRSHVSQMI
jgi:hypothetical protein